MIVIFVLSFFKVLTSGEVAVTFLEPSCVLYM